MLVLFLSLRSGLLSKVNNFSVVTNIIQTELKKKSYTLYPINNVEKYLHHITELKLHSKYCWGFYFYQLDAMISKRSKKKDKA